MTDVLLFWRHRNCPSKAALKNCGSRCAFVALAALLALIPVSADNAFAQADVGTLPPPYASAQSSSETIPPPPGILPTAETVLDVRIVGNKSVPLQRINPHIMTRPGRPLDLETVEDDMRRLNKSRLFVTVNTEFQKTDKGTIVIFQVVERPVLHYVKYFGHNVRTRTLEKMSGLKKGDPLDPYLVEEARRKLEEFYHEKGYAKASVVILEGTNPNDRGAAFLINEGFKQKIEDVEFEGNTFVSGARLKTQIQSKPPILGVFKGEVNQEKIDADKERLTAYYRAHGFFQAVVGVEPIFHDDPSEWTPGMFSFKKVTLRFVINEGPRFRVRNISVAGNSKFPTSVLTSDLGLKPGDYFVQSTADADVAKIQEVYGANGHIFAAVEPDIKFLLDPPAHVDLVYKVEEGARYRIGKIEVVIKGESPHTRRNTVLNRLSLRTGDIADIRELRASERRLRASNLFVHEPMKGVSPQIRFVRPGSEEAMELASGNAGKYRGQSPDDPNAERVCYMVIEGELSPNAPVEPEPLRQPAPQQLAPQQQSTQQPATRGAAVQPPQQSTYTRPIYRGQSPGVGYPYDNRAVDRAMTSQYTPYSGQAMPTTTTPSPRSQTVYSPREPAPAGGYPTQQAQYTVPQTPAQPQYQAPPANQFAAPPYSPPPQQYSAPQQQYSAPQQQYAAPGYATPGSLFDPAAGSYDNVPGSVIGPSAVIPQYGYDDPNALFPAEPHPFLGDPGPLPEAPVIVQVEEAQTGRFMLGIGVNSDAGVVGNIMLDEQNFDITRWPTGWGDIRNGTAFRGAGQQFRLEAMPGTEVQRYVINFREPYLFDSRVSFGISGYYYDRIFNDWTENRLGGRISFGYQLSPDLSATIALRGEEVTLTRPRVPTPPELAAALGDSELYGARIGLTHDTRDSSFLPTQGHIIDVGFEQVFGTYSYPRFTAEGRQYFLISERPDMSGRQVLAVGSEVGITGNDTPIYENFFAGGSQSLRGFRFRGAVPRDLGVAVGGEFLWVSSVEYLFPITADDMLRGVVFTDFGTVERDIELHSENFRVSIGAGFRIMVPALGPAPIALDFAGPLTHADGDRIQNFSFTIGLFR